MGRRKGIPNKGIDYKRPQICQMSIEDRMRLIANIIIDRIQADLHAEKDQAKEVSDV